MFYIRKSKSLIGGNINDQTLIDLPNGIVFKDEIFAPCEILDGSWTPYGNTGYVNGRNEKITVRCKDSASAGVVIATFVVPTSSIKLILLHCDCYSIIIIQSNIPAVLLIHNFRMHLDYSM